ncbi:MAG: glycoside hydrolase family 5 protein [Myxococcales bacterium]
MQTSQPHRSWASTSNPTDGDGDSDRDEGDGDGDGDRGDSSDPEQDDDAGEAAPDASDMEPGAGDGDTEQVPAQGPDEIFGVQVTRTDSWWVKGRSIYYGDKEVRLYGLNWFGLETESRALFGPTEAKRSVADFLDQIKGLGFTALRVPLSPESIDPGYPSADWAKRGEVDTGREGFEELAKAAKAAGIYMLWDIHTCSSAVGFKKTGPLDPACTGYGKTKWLANLKTLAELAKTYAPYVVGIDLFNEPYGLRWEDWKALAEEGGKTVLTTNPKILTFVEGVGSEGFSGSAPVFWGENLTGVAAAPVKLPKSRLVYSPHVYGPSVYAQPYFSVADFPNNMPAIWGAHFGYLLDGDEPLVPGEFGGRYMDADKKWQDAFVSYLVEKKAHNFFYWCLNPNSGDTGGLLNDDFKTVNNDKLSLLKRLMKP